MKKEITGGGLFLFVLLFMMGCGNKIPEMTDQQQDLVVEYAANTVLKYDQNYGSRLIDLSLVENAEAKEPAQEEQAPDEAEDEEQQKDNEAVQGDVEVIDRTQNSQEEFNSIESFLQLDSVRITYTGYKTVDMYPDENESSDLYFFMNATPGNQLLVLEFMAENLSGSDMELNIAQSNARFKIVVDGVEKNALTTMLLNDLAYFNGMLAAGESRELVLVCEIPAEQAEQISSLALNMKSVDNMATISLE